MELPSIKHKPDRAKSFQVGEDSYGLPIPMYGGSNSTKSQLNNSHPLESAIKNFQADQIKLNNSVMFHAQGPAGPIIQAMELKAAKQIGRLPFLSSSNFQLDVLTGKDLDIDFDDFLNTEEFKEVRAHPHVVMENLSPKMF